MKRVLALCVACVLCAAIPPVGQAQKVPPAPASEPAPQTASRWVAQRGSLVVHTRHTDSFVEFSREEGQKLLEWVSKIPSHSQQALGLKPEEADKFVKYKVESGQSAIDRLIIRVRIDKVSGIDEAKAKKFIADEFAAYKKLGRDIQQASYAKSVGDAEKKLTNAELEANRKTDLGRQLRAELQEMSGEIDVSVKSLTDVASKTQTLFHQLDIDHEAKQARHRALEDAIAKLSVEVEKKVQSDPVAAELEKVVAAREKGVERLKEMVAKNAASKTEAEEKVGEVAEARAKLMERRRDAAAEAGGTLIAQLNKDLLMLSIDSAEENMRYKMLAERSKALRSSLDGATRLQTLQREAGSLEAEISNNQSELERAKTFAGEENLPDLSLEDLGVYNSTEEDG
jgi:hypothetical protein